MDVGFNQERGQMPCADGSRISITTEEINNLPLRGYNGKTSVISDSSRLARVIREIEQYSVIGFDTETRPSFRKGQIYDVSLLQLATPRKVYLIRLNHTGVTDEVAALLSNPRVTKAGVGIRDDIKALQRLRPFEAAGFCDLSTLAKQAGLQVESVKKLTALLLGFRISKSAQTSNWEVRTFTSKQIEYAATDAWVCLELFYKLRPKDQQRVSGRPVNAV